MSSSWFSLTRGAFYPLAIVTVGVYNYVVLYIYNISFLWFMIRRTKVTKRERGGWELHNAAGFLNFSEAKRGTNAACMEIGGFCPPHHDLYN